MNEFQQRTRILIGDDGLQRLAGKRILVAGLGGVGGACTEALARAGIGHLTLVDHDTVSPSNLNRQLIALHSTVGRPKAAVMGERLQDIDPHIDIDARQTFIQPDGIDELLGNTPYDYVLDCIDSIACKAALVAGAQARGIPVASSMGAGGRLDVTRVHMTHLKRTENCGLARELRKRLRRLGASLDYPVVHSTEPAVNAQPHQPIEGDPNARPRAVNGTISYMPNLFGLMLAGHVIRQMLDNEA